MTIRIGIVVAVIGCGGSRPVTSRPPPDAAPPPAAVRLPSSVPGSWDDVAREMQWLYVGPIEQASTSEGINQLCVTPERVDVGPVRSMPGKVCSAIAAIDGLPAPGEAFPVNGDRVWAAIGGGGIIAIAADPCAAPGCPDPPRDVLLHHLVCGRLDHLWANLPDGDVRCTAGTDCVLLQAMCFTSAVRADAATPYRDLVKRTGGGCIAPNAGACPTVPTTAVCAAGRCTTHR